MARAILILAGLVLLGGCAATMGASIDRLHSVNVRGSCAQGNCVIVWDQPMPTPDPKKTIQDTPAGVF